MCIYIHVYIYKYVYVFGYIYVIIYIRVLKYITIPINVCIMCRRCYKRVYYIVTITKRNWGNGNKDIFTQEYWYHSIRTSLYKYIII